MSSSKVCDLCGGRGYIEYATEGNGAPIALPPTTSGNMYLWDHPQATLATANCACREQAAAAKRIESVMDGSSGVPMRYRGFTFETFDAMPDEWKQGKTPARQVAEMFARGPLVDDNEREKWGLVLSGPTGHGKSGLAAAILWNKAISGSTVMWVDFAEFIQKCKATIRDESLSFDEIVSAASSAPFLVWDDFADQERPGPVTEYVRDVTYQVIGYRHRNHMPMLITTNLTDDQLYRQFGDRIGDRVFEMCYWQSVEGGNLRFAR